MGSRGLRRAQRRMYGATRQLEAETDPEVRAQLEALIEGYRAQWWRRMEGAQQTELDRQRIRALRARFSDGPFF